MVIDKNYRESYKTLFVEVMRKDSLSFYDESALPSYTHGNRLMSWLFWKRIDIAISMAGDVRDKVVLDFGCGGGVTFGYLASKGARIFACENQFYHLTEFISERIGAAATIYKELSNIKGIKFDLILALDVLEHVEDINEVLNTMVILSHESTKLIVSGPTENHIYKIGRLLAGFSGHYHRRNIYDIEKKLFEKGFKMISLKRLYPFFRISSWKVLNG